MKKSEQMAESDVESVLTRFFAEEVPGDLPRNPQPPSADSMIGWTELAVAESSDLVTKASTPVPSVVSSIRMETPAGAPRSFGMVLIGAVAMLCTVIMLGRSMSPRTQQRPTVATTDDSADQTVLVAIDETADAKSVEPADTDSHYNFSKIFETENGPVELRTKLKLRRVSVGDGSSSPQIDLIIPELDVEFLLDESDFPKKNVDQPQP